MSRKRRRRGNRDPERQDRGLVTGRGRARANEMGRAALLCGCAGTQPALCAGDSPHFTICAGDSNCKFSRENLSGLSKQTDGYPLRVSVGKRGGAGDRDSKSDTVAAFLVYCPREKEQGYRADQVLSPCQPSCAPCVLLRRQVEGPRGCADAPRRGRSTS